MGWLSSELSSCERIDQPVHCLAFEELVLKGESSHVLKHLNLARFVCQACLNTLKEKKWIAVTFEFLNLVTNLVGLEIRKHLVKVVGKIGKTNDNDAELFVGEEVVGRA